MKQKAIGGLMFFLFLAICFGVAALGSAFTTPYIDSWYSQINQPSWTPPDAAFPPVWSTLFFLMAVSAWLVWKKTGWKKGRWPLGIFFVQLALNACWSFLFFTMQSPGSALIEIVFLWLAILFTIIEFFKVRAIAGWINVPYLIWVSYAAALNCAIWWIN